MTTLEDRIKAWAYSTPHGHAAHEVLDILAMESDQDELKQRIQELESTLSRARDEIHRISQLMGNGRTR